MLDGVQSSEGPPIGCAELQLDGRRRQRKKGLEIETIRACFSSRVRGERFSFFLFSKCVYERELNPRKAKENFQERMAFQLPYY